MPLDLDPRFSFDSFVVGSANRLAVAAARRVADAPGASYNPLFIYSASGLGKTHLLTAIGHYARRIHGSEVVLETTEHLMEEISVAVAAGERDVFRARIRDADVILLDDVQFLGGQRQTQDELIRAWDDFTSHGGQVVLTSDRPPQEIDELDERLLSRLSGGLIVDMSVPDYETRIAIARRKADERGQRLATEVLQALARVAFTNVRELQGALNRVIAVQELERRIVRPDEVDALLGAAAERGRDEFGEFLSEITGTVSAVVAEADRRIADAIFAWEGEGFRTRRLEGALASTLTAAQAADLIRRFEADASRLREIEASIRSLDPDARELRSEVLRDPDRTAEAEALLFSVRARRTPPPGPPPGVSLEDLDGDSLALRAARAVAASPGTDYNPLYVLGPAGAGKSVLLAGLGNALARDHRFTVAYTRSSDFAAELIDAIEHGRLEAWRARYHRADALLLDDLDEFAGTEGAQEELFHLFEDLHRNGRQLVFAAASPPQALPVAERLRTRLESGLVVELEPRELAAGDGTSADQAQPKVNADGDEAALPGRTGRAWSWLLSREKVLWEWPYAEDWIEESLD